MGGLNSGQARIAKQNVDVQVCWILHLQGINVPRIVSGGHGERLGSGSTNGGCPHHCRGMGDLAGEGRLRGCLKCCRLYIKNNTSITLRI